MTTRIITGDARTAMADIPDGSIQCCVTSPPYFGLRDYGTATWEGGDPACDHAKERRPRSERPDAHGFGTRAVLAAQDAGSGAYRSTCGKCGAVRVDTQIGLEPTMAEYIANLVAVFREVRRALRDDGTLWLNLGDSYVSSPRGNKPGDLSTSSLTNPERQDGVARGSTLNAGMGLKPKDLMMVPARVALALQDDGWWLRSKIVWHKPNPMPESVTDRPTNSYEEVFLLTKRARYYYDADAIAEPVAGQSVERNNDQHPRNGGSPHAAHGSSQGNGRIQTKATGRNARNVWTITTAPYAAAHFATFPPEIPRRCILAGTSERGQCPACGAPWTRVVERESNWQERKALGGTAGNVGASVTYQNGVHGGRVNHDLQGTSRFIGWSPSCACVDAGEPVPQTVLDPFSGAGTTGLVADRLGRHYIGIELNPEYVALSESRIRNDAPLFATEIPA